MRLSTWIGRNESGAGAFYRSSRKCWTEEGIEDGIWVGAALGRGVFIAVCFDTQFLLKRFYRMASYPIPSPRPRRSA